jgi:hypothetical protein
MGMRAVANLMSIILLTCGGTPHKMWTRRAGYPARLTNRPLTPRFHQCVKIILI